MSDQPDSGSNWYMRQHDGVQHSPFPAEHLLQENIASDTEVRHEIHTKGSWVQRSEVEILNLLGKGYERQNEYLKSLENKPQRVINRPTEDLGTKKCPYCAETIQSAAIKCRYCGSDFFTEKPLTRKHVEEVQKIETQIYLGCICLLVIAGLLICVIRLATFGAVWVHTP